MVRFTDRLGMPIDVDGDVKPCDNTTILENNFSTCLSESNLRFVTFVSLIFDSFRSSNDCAGYILCSCVQCV